MSAKHEADLDDIVTFLIPPNKQLYLEPLPRSMQERTTQVMHRPNQQNKHQCSTQQLKEKREMPKTPSHGGSTIFHSATTPVVRNNTDYYPVESAMKRKRTDERVHKRIVGTSSACRGPRFHKESGPASSDQSQDGRNIHIAQRMSSLDSFSARDAGDLRGQGHRPRVVLWRLGEEVWRRDIVHLAHPPDPRLPKTIAQEGGARWANQDTDTWCCCVWGANLKIPTGSIGSPMPPNRLTACAPNCPNIPLNGMGHRGNFVYSGICSRPMDISGLRFLHYSDLPLPTHAVDWAVEGFQEFQQTRHQIPKWKPFVLDVETRRCRTNNFLCSRKGAGVGKMHNQLEMAPT